MREVGKHQHEALWVDALEAKYEGKGDAWSTKEDFERILKDFQVIRLRKFAASVSDSYRACQMYQLWYSQESSSQHIQMRA